MDNVKKAIMIEKGIQYCQTVLSQTFEYKIISIPTISPFYEE